MLGGSLLRLGWAWPGPSFPSKRGSPPPGVSIFRRVSAEGCRGIFGMAGPPVPVVSDAFRWSRGLVSGPTFRPAGGPSLSCRQGASTHVATGAPGLPESWPGGLLFCPFCPAFSGLAGCAGDPGRGDFSPDREKRTCVRKVRGVSSYGLWGLRAPALCNERSFRTDVSICTIYRYGSARAGVQEKCPAVREGGTGGVLV